ncbi:MAG: hypothetical protein Q7S33_04450 [Nanoarchaeota archaeon]|nr:hypothetical protein [Nanoarchaeota archaeon]
MADKYIGIENELTSFNDENEEIDFKKYFDRFANDSDYRKARNAIRTTTGNGFYVDGAEIEILTPPILINKGFATRLTDSLMIGRDRVVKSIPELRNTGYSMHWNLSSQKELQEISDNYRIEKISDFYKRLIIPFHLFGLTPLSVGLAIRDRTSLGRYELLGDSINNEEQINALGLMLGAYSHLASNLDKHDKNFHLYYSNFNFFSVNCRIDSFLKNKRYSYFDSNQGEIQAQQYLEMFYKWIEPFVSVLGTKKEVQNLEDFIEGRKQLEFDKFKYYNCLNEMNFKSGGTYLPNELFKAITLTETRERKIPLEGELLGEIVKQLKDKIEEMSWNNITINDNNSEIKGIREIYEFARRLNTKLPTLKEINLDELQTQHIDFGDLLDSAGIKQDVSKDTSLDLPEKDIKEFFKLNLSPPVYCKNKLGRFSKYYDNETRKAKDVVCEECAAHNNCYPEIRDNEKPEHGLEYKIKGLEDFREHLLHFNGQNFNYRIEYIFDESGRRIGTRNRRTSSIEGTDLQDNEIIPPLISLRNGDISRYLDVLNPDRREERNNEEGENNDR